MFCLQIARCGRTSGEEYTIFCVFPLDLKRQGEYTYIHEGGVRKWT